MERVDTLEKLRDLGLSPEIILSPKSPYGTTEVYKLLRNYIDSNGSSTSKSAIDRYLTLEVGRFIKAYLKKKHIDTSPAIVNKAKSVLVPALKRYATDLVGAKRVQRTDQLAAVAVIGAEKVRLGDQPGVVVQKQTALQTFLAPDGEYENYVIYNLLDRFGAFVDMFHDWYNGFRLKMSADRSGVDYSRRYLTEAVEREIVRIQTPAWREQILPGFDARVGADNINQVVSNYISWLRNVLLGNLSKIESSFQYFLETAAGVPWISPLDANAQITYSDLLDIAPTREQAIAYAIQMRNRYFTFMLLTGDGRPLRDLNEPEQEIVGVFIVAYQFGSGDAKCYFTCDAAPKDVRKALRHLRNVFGLITPQNIADSATTSLNNPLSKHNPDVFAAPQDAAGGGRFTSAAKVFTPELDTYFQNGPGGGFSQVTPYNWSQNIVWANAAADAAAAAAAAAAGWARPIQVVYGPGFGNEGASINHLMGLQKMIDSVGGDGATAADVAAVRAEKHVNLGPLIAPNFNWIRTRLAARDGSILAGIKYAGDKDQGETLKRLRGEFTNVCNVTLDRTQFNIVRLANSPAILHHNDTFLLSRATVTETPPTLEEREGYRKNKIFSDLQQVIKIVTEVCSVAPGAAAGSPSRLALLLASINRRFTEVIDAPATDPLKRYLYQVKRDDIQAYFGPRIADLTFTVNGINLCGLLGLYTNACDTLKNEIRIQKQIVAEAKRIKNRNRVSADAYVAAKRQLIGLQTRNVIEEVANQEANQIIGGTLDQYIFIITRARRIWQLQQIIPLRNAIKPFIDIVVSVILDIDKYALMDAAVATANAAAAAGADPAAAVIDTIRAVPTGPFAAHARATIDARIAAIPATNANIRTYAQLAIDANARIAASAAILEAAIAGARPATLDEYQRLLAAFVTHIPNPSPIYAAWIERLRDGIPDQAVAQEIIRELLKSIIADQLKSILDIINSQIQAANISPSDLIDLINIDYEPGEFRVDRACPPLEFYPSKITNLINDYRAIQRWKSNADILRVAGTPAEFGRVTPADFMKHLFDYNTGLRMFCGGLYNEAPVERVDAIVNAGGPPQAGLVGAVPPGLTSGQDIYQAYAIGLGPVIRRAIRYAQDVEQEVDDEEEESARDLVEFGDYVNGGLLINPDDAAGSIQANIQTMRTRLADYNRTRTDDTRRAFYRSAADVLRVVSMPAGFNEVRAADPAAAALYPFRQVGGVRDVELGDIIRQYFAGMAACVNQYINRLYPLLHLRYRIENYRRALRRATANDLPYVRRLGSGLTADLQAFAAAPTTAEATRARVRDIEAAIAADAEPDLSILVVPTRIEIIIALRVTDIGDIASRISTQLLNDLTVDLTERSERTQVIDYLERYLLGPFDAEGGDVIPRLLSLTLMADFVLQPSNGIPALSYLNIVIPELQGMHIVMDTNAHASLLNILPALPITLMGGAEFTRELRGLLGLQRGGARRRTRRIRDRKSHRKTLRSRRD